MKKVITLILLLFVVSLQAQIDITGSWRKSVLFHSESREGFELYPGDPNSKNGGVTTFQNGTFSTTGGPVICLSGITDFKPWNGVYTYDDDNYITIHAAEGKNNVIDEVGVKYYVYKTNGGYRFITSVGNLATDKIQAEDYDFLETFLRTHTEIGLKRQDWKRIKAKTDDEIFAKGLALTSDLDPAKAEMLFIENFDHDFYRLFLFEYEGKKQILIYVDHHLGVCLYDDSHNVVKFTN